MIISNDVPVVLLSFSGLQCHAYTESMKRIFFSAVLLSFSGLQCHLYTESMKGFSSLLKLWLLELFPLVITAVTAI